MRSPNKPEEDAIRQRVNDWKVEYALSESVAKELLEIEKGFHLSGGFLSLDSAPTHEESAAHERVVKSLLGTAESSH
jgi:hypothetical protein